MELYTKKGTPKNISIKKLSGWCQDPIEAGQDNYVCKKCQLHRKCKNPFKVEDLQRTESNFLVVLDHYDGEETKQRLRSIIGKYYPDLTINFVYTTLCHPRNPEKVLDHKVHQLCRGFLLHQIEYLNPKYILAVGDGAAESLLNVGTYRIEANLGKILSIEGTSRTFVATLPPRLYEGTKVPYKKPNPLVITQIYRDISRFDKKTITVPAEAHVYGKCLGFDTEFRTSDRTSWTISFADEGATETYEVQGVSIEDKKALESIIQTSKTIYAHYAHVDIDELVRNGLATERLVKGENVWCTNIADPLFQGDPYGTFTSPPCR